MDDVIHCRSCAKVIVFQGRVPCDPSLVIIVLDDGTTARGKISHFATCPSADRHRDGGIDPLYARILEGFDIRTEKDLTVGHGDTLLEAGDKRDQLARVLRKRLRIHWYDNAEVLTAAVAEVVLALGPDAQAADEPDPQVGLDLEPPDPRPNSPEDVGFDGR